MTWSRRLRTALTVLAISFIVTAQIALAADPNTGPTNPTGFGDLLPTPDLTHGDTRTLFESYSPMLYTLDFDKGISDTFNMIFNGYALIVMMFVTAITRAAISVGWWLFSFTDVTSLTDATSATVGATGTQLAGWLLPSALAFGAVAAYTQRKTSGSALGQLMWVFVAGLLSISFALAPGTWIRGVDGARQLGAGAVMTASSDAMGPTMQTPVAWPEPGFTGTPKDTLLRKSADASWRGFVVTPWCIAEFGSIAACQRYGKGLLEVGTDADARNKYINDVVAPAEGGGDAPTVKWLKGDNPFGRVAVVMIAGIAATLFAFLNIALAFTALMAFIGCLLLLVVGVFFACLWIIPGRPRQWGLNWFEALIGLVLQSFLAMLIFGTALTLLTAVFSLSGTLGWLPVTGLAICVLIVGVRVRRLLDSLTTMMRPGTGSIMLGNLARRGATGAVQRLASAISNRGATPVPAERTRDRQTQTGTSPQYASSVRVFRQAPAIGAGGRPASGGSPYELTTGADRRRHETTAAIGSGGGGLSTATESSRTSQREGARKSPAISLSRARARASGESGRTVSVSSSSAIVSTSTPSTSRAGTSDVQRARHSKRIQASSVSDARYEPRAYVPSASLREGPPKTRSRRRGPAPTQRRFREYSQITKDGVTVHVPKRR
ncbi:hypothetical protein [Kribbella sp. NPDC006257]|uniref:hypothetical protein n=1 Tax=Kribbella sp. NPDC006257 TaxID=3156738 RepID=UPI0033B905D5